MPKEKIKVSIFALDNNAAESKIGEALVYKEKLKSFPAAIYWAGELLNRTQLKEHKLSETKHVKVKIFPLT